MDQNYIPIHQISPHPANIPYDLAVNNGAGYVEEVATRQLPPHFINGGGYENGEVLMEGPYTRQLTVGGGGGGGGGMGVGDPCTPMGVGGIEGGGESVRGFPRHRHTTQLPGIPDTGYEPDPSKSVV